MTDNIVVFTGGFDPIHSGHIEAIKHAQSLGKVVIGLNSDDWLVRKKGRPFMPFSERKSVLDQFKNIEAVIDFDDTDGSAVDAIRKAKQMFPERRIIFVNGGDRTKENIPEMAAFAGDPQVSFEFGVGGNDKRNSSSWILSEWKHPSETRIWGKFVNYYQSSQVKIKRLIIEPSKTISMQYHNNRSEFWFIEEGTGTLYTLENDQEVLLRQLNKHEYIYVDTKQWHRLENNGVDDLCVIEIQYGKECVESDIVRK